MESKPEEKEVERYLITNEMGETFYVYCKVIYEEITEEFLYKNYDIKNVQAKKREIKGERLDKMLGQSMILFSSTTSPAKKKEQKIAKIPSYSKELAKSNGTALRKGIDQYNSTESIDKKNTASNSPPKMQEERKSIVSVSGASLDEMDAPGTAYSKVKRKARKKTNTGIDKIERLPLVKQFVHHTVFVPLAVCIKTKNQYHGPAEQLLSSLIQLLYTEVDTYKTQVQNCIYRYAEFVSHTILLTHIVSPPPMTQYVIEIGGNKVVYTEGMIGDFPCESDVSVAQLFSIVNPIEVISIWTAMLLDIRVLVYTTNVNYFFFIIKGINQLMFPFCWHHSKGIIPSLLLLCQPPPYCYGIMQSKFPDKEGICQTLENEKIQYIMLDTEVQEGNQRLITFPKDCTPIFPNEHEMHREIIELCNEYGITKSGLLSKTERMHIDFSHRMRHVFFEQLTKILKDFDHILKNTVSDDFYDFSIAFLQNYKDKTTYIRKPGEFDFIKELVDSQCFAYFYDEALHEEQKNYARIMAMKRNYRCPLNEIANVGITSPHEVTMSRLSRLSNAASKERNKRENKDKANLADSPLLLKEKINWFDEIEKMQGAAQKTIARVIKAKKSAFRLSISSECPSPKLQPSPRLSSPKKETEISLRISEVDATITMEESKFFKEETKEGFYYKTRAEKKRKGPLFYGPTGILAFLHEMFCMGKNEKNKLNLFEDVEHFIEKSKFTGDIEESKMVDNEMHSEGSEGEEPLAKDISIVDLLVDTRKNRGASVNIKTEAPFLFFDSPNSPNFHLFCAIYFSRYKQHPYDIVKVIVIFD